MTQQFEIQTDQLVNGDRYFKVKARTYAEAERKALKVIKDSPDAAGQAEIYSITREQ